MKIDARRRIDALLVGSLDANLQQALVAANGAREGKLPDKAKADAKKALGSINDNMPVDWRDDALFAVDRDGRVVAQVGYDVVAGNDDFELGGYPAVNDALHGWLRDDVWVLGSHMYVVVSRPVEYDASQRPAGAIVGLKEINKKFADDLAKRTRTNVVFYALGKSVASAAGVDPFEDEKLDSINSDLKNIDDKAYGDAGRTDARMLVDDLGAVYARLPGDAWGLAGGFAVMRSRAVLTSPLSFLSNADDRDKANVPWGLLAAAAILAAAIGVALTVLEHTMPLRELLMQANRLKGGMMETLQVARFRGSYRLAAQGINEGIERSIEKAGGVTRKPADLESILGPTPAQPSMSAFSFPNADAEVPPLPPPPGPAAPPPRAPGPLAAPKPAPVAPVPAPIATPATQPRAPGPPPPAPRPVPVPQAPPPGRSHAGSPPAGDDEDATMVGAVPAELLAQATGEGRAAHEEAVEWLSVFDDFIRTKRQCGEPVDGLTFEKFSQTLKKNRDTLMQRHGCRRVKFSVYVKDGRASLKATPVKD
jgi:hypothetical protein